MKPLKLLASKIRRPNGLSRSRFIATISSLANGKYLSRIRALKAKVLRSNCVLFLFALGDVDNKGITESLDLDKIAYAIPSYGIFSEDKTIASSSAYSQQELHLPLFASLYWLETPTLQIKYPLPLRLNAYLNWWHKNAPPHLLQADNTLNATTVSDKHRAGFCDKEFGVNLIGHAFNIIGLGEYLRMIAKALDAAGIPYCVINIPIGCGVSDQDRSLEQKVLPSNVEPPYAFNLLCMTAETTYVKQFIMVSSPVIAPIALPSGSGKWKNGQISLPMLWILPMNTGLVPASLSRPSKEPGQKGKRKD